MTREDVRDVKPRVKIDRVGFRAPVRDIPRGTPVVASSMKKVSLVILLEMDTLNLHVVRSYPS